jgi:hypothetical protein
VQLKELFVQARPAARLRDRTGRLPAAAESRRLTSSLSGCRSAADWPRRLPAEDAPTSLAQGQREAQPPVAAFLSLCLSLTLSLCVPLSRCGAESAAFPAGQRRNPKTQTKQQDTQGGRGAWCFS